MLDVGDNFPAQLSITEIL
jgi:hypothetical protein